MAVWWPVWPMVLCLICAWLAVGLGLGLGVFWVLAGSVACGGVAAVISGAGLAGALCALVWRVWGAGAGQQMLSRFSAFWRVLACWTGLGGLWRDWLWGWLLLHHRGWLLWSGFRMYPGLVLVAVVGLVRVGHGAGAGRVAGWLQEVACLLYSI